MPLSRFPRSADLLPDGRLRAAHLAFVERRAVAAAGETLFCKDIARAGLHEVYSATEADAAAATGFVLGTIGQWIAARDGAKAAQPGLFWVRQHHLHAETGRIHAPGLVEFGIPPQAVTMISAPDVRGLLQAGLEGARCAGLLAVLAEFRGDTRQYDLVASRRLTRAAKETGVAVFVLRHGAAVTPSAAESRWTVESLPSRPLAANAPGFPAFGITLLRHRGGREGQHWAVEWNRDQARFDDRAEDRALPRTESGYRAAAPLSGAVVPVSARRTAAAS
jgi:protein ImuA